MNERIFKEEIKLMHDRLFLVSIAIKLRIADSIGNIGAIIWRVEKNTEIFLVISLSHYREDMRL